MNACFDNNIEDTELILRIILNRNDITVKSVKTQQLMKNLQGRDVCLDIDAKDRDDNEFNSQKGQISFQYAGCVLLKTAVFLDYIDD